MSRHGDRGPERRREPRVTGAGLRARIRPGHRLAVLDLNSHGALVEAGRPLRPGSRLDLQLETDTRHGTVAAMVVRCAVAAIDSETGVTYHAALCFTETCEWVREVLTHSGYRVPGEVSVASTSAPAAENRLPGARGEDARSQAGVPK